MEAVHPGKLVSSQITDDVRKFSSEAEKLGELHPEQLKIIYEQNWFNLFVPKEYGGLGLGLIDALQVEESLAWIDGSFGWTVTLCAGANWFVGFLVPDAAKEIFSNKKACLAGSGKPSGIAKEIDDGYEVTGFWKYATGAPHATVFTANCLIEKDEVQLKNDAGDPLILSFWFKKEVDSIKLYPSR